MNGLIRNVIVIRITYSNVTEIRILVLLGETRRNMIADESFLFACCSKPYRNNLESMTKISNMYIDKCCKIFRCLHVVRNLGIFFIVIS